MRAIPLYEGDDRPCTTDSVTPLGTDRRWAGLDNLPNEHMIPPFDG